MIFIGHEISREHFGMLIYRCDRCGKEHVEAEIVGNEFKYAKIGFDTLAVPVEHMRDLCRDCYRIAQDIHQRHDESSKEARRIAMRAALAHIVLAKPSRFGWVRREG